MKKIVLLLAILVISSCSKYSNFWNVSQFRAINEYVQDIPLPGDILIDAEKTFIILVQDNWIGKVTGVVESNPSEVYRIYKQDMPDTGWKLMADIQGMENLIVYEKSDRIAIIRIEKESYNYSAITITVLKKHQFYQG